MTVSELEKLLSNFPSDMPVLVDGYEWGYNAPTLTQVKNIISTPDTPSYGGKFDDSTDKTVGFKAVLLSRQPLEELESCDEDKEALC